MAISVIAKVSTPVVSVINWHRSADGWIEITSIDTTLRAAAYFPISAAVVQFDSMFTRTDEWATKMQVQFREVAVASSPIHAPLLVYLYGTGAPATPIVGTVYNGSSTNLIGIASITAGHYQRLSSTESIATAEITQWIKNPNNASNASVIFAVVVGNAAYDYAASATGFLRIAVLQAG